MEHGTKRTLVVFIGIVGLLLVFFFVLSTGHLIFDFFMNEPHYATSYQNITVDTAKELLVSGRNITIVDCSSCKCSYKSGHLPDAEWHQSPEELYNMTCDLLVYDNDGQNSGTFCDQLRYHTYGRIYNMLGGYSAWQVVED